MIAMTMWAALQLGPPEPTPIPPGGYWSLGEARERQGEPPDGEASLSIGSVLLSIGLLRVGSAAINVWMASRSDVCPFDEKGCASFGNFGWYGVGEGSLMFVTGVVYLAIGGTRRARYQRWKSGGQAWLSPDRFQLVPWVSVRDSQRGAGLRLELRF